MHASKRISVVFAAVLLGGSQCFAQVADAAKQADAPAVAAENDEDAQIDDGLRRFGYLAGLARGCVVDAQRTLVEREVVDLHAGIDRLMGSDRAFLFAAAYGFGTNVSTEAKDCGDVLKTYDARVEKHRASARGAR